MKVLNNQSIEDLRPEILLAMRLLEDLYSREGEEMEVSWTTGGKHMVGSLHPKRRAFDALPPPVIPGAIVRLAQRILGADYDLILEPGCLHVEWDPK